MQGILSLLVFGPSLLMALVVLLRKTGGFQRQFKSMLATSTAAAGTTGGAGKVAQMLFDVAPLHHSPLGLRAVLTHCLLHSPDSALILVLRRCVLCVVRAGSGRRRGPVRWRSVPRRLCAE